MVTKTFEFNDTLELRRKRTITAEIFEDGTIGLEIKKDAVRPEYKNGESDYHEVFMNLTYEELDALVEFIMNVMSIKKEGGITIETGEFKSV